MISVTSPLPWALLDEFEGTSYCNQASWQSRFCLHRHDLHVCAWLVLNSPESDSWFSITASQSDFTCFQLQESLFHTFHFLFLFFPLQNLSLYVFNGYLWWQLQIYLRFLNSSRRRQAHKYTIFECVWSQHTWTAAHLLGMSLSVDALSFLEKYNLHIRWEWKQKSRTWLNNDNRL